MMMLRPMLAFALVTPMCAWAAEFTGSANADTTISIGTLRTDIPGEIVVGASGAGGIGRALIRFDLSGLPTNAVIDSTRVTLKITKEASTGPEPANFKLHRVTRTWNEAQATWTEAASGTSWSSVGGDFVSLHSAAQIAGGAGNTIDFMSTDLAADVQSWINGSAINAGWLVRVADESEDHSARRIASREAGADGPKLTVTYHLPVTIVEPSLVNVRISGGLFRFDFQANAGTFYAVEYLNAIETDWQPLTNVTVTSLTLATISDVRTNAQRFYRVTASAAP